MKVGIKKKDLWLIILVILIAGAFYLFHEITGKADAGRVTVKVDGKVTGSYSLDKNQKIEINNGSNTLLIKDGKASMLEADCPDKLCVHQRAISKYHESIICLPNKVVAEVTGGDNGDYDAIVN